MIKMFYMLILFFAMPLVASYDINETGLRRFSRLSERYKHVISKSQVKNCGSLVAPACNMLYEQARELAQKEALLAIKQGQLKGLSPLEILYATGGNVYAVEAFWRSVELQDKK